MPGVVIEANDVGKTYAAARAPVTALSGVSLSVREREFVSIVGPSGCGKSTLLQILAGLVEGSQGQVLVDGVPVTAPMPDKIAVVFQDATLLPWKTAAANVAFPLELRGIDARTSATSSLEMLRLVGLGDFADRYPHELSGGMKQRVSIARGLVQNPRIILMDEPFGALDEQTRTKMGHELLQIWQRTGKTILFITHSLTEALYLSDRVLVMSHRPGHILEEVVVDLPRPRNYDVIGSEAFGRYRNRIWQLIAGSETASTQEAPAL